MNGIAYALHQISNQKHSKCPKYLWKYIWDALGNFAQLVQQKWKNTHVRMLLLVKLQALASNITKSNISSWVFFTFLKLYKWYESCNTPHLPSYLWNGMLHKPFVWGHFTLNLMRIMQAAYFIFVIHKLRNCWKY